MKFTTLEIDNFLAISHANINLSDRGLVLIQGENQDDTSANSNGAGKSSLPDALCWALTGETARGDSGDTVINDKAGKGTRVRVDIEEDDDVWRIARHRKHAKHKNSLIVLHLAKDGTITDHTKGTDKLTQVVVDKVLGCSSDVFRASIYAAQERMPDLPAMTDKNLKMLIEEASGVTLLEAAYKEARTRWTAAQADVETNAREIEKVEDKKTFIANQIVTATANRDAWTLDQANQIAARKAEIRTRVETVKKLDEDLAKFDEKALTDGIAICDGKLHSLLDEQKELIAHQRAASTGEATVGQHRRTATNLKSQHDNIKVQIAALDATIGELCTECGRAHDKETLAVHRESLVGKTKLIAGDFADAKKLMEQAQKLSEKLTSALDAFQATMTDPGATSAERASLQAQLDAMKAVARQRHDEATRAKALGEEARSLSCVINPHNSTLSQLQGSLTDLSEKQGELDKRLLELEVVRDTADAVMKVFSPSGVRAHILDEVTPYLNQQTAKYLDTLSDGNIRATWSTLVPNAKGDLKEKFSIEVENDKGGKKFSLQSGGEKRKVRLATALALQDLVSTRATKPIELFIGDEIDDALDAAGLERLTQILEEKAKERGSVFIISHSDLKDWVSQVITVRKKDGETELLETTS